METSEGVFLRYDRQEHVEYKIVAKTAGEKTCVEHVNSIHIDIVETRSLG